MSEPRRAEEKGEGRRDHGERIGGGDESKPLADNARLQDTAIGVQLSRQEIGSRGVQANGEKGLAVFQRELKIVRDNNLTSWAGQRNVCNGASIGGKSNELLQSGWGSLEIYQYTKCTMPAGQRALPWCDDTYIHT